MATHREARAKWLADAGGLLLGEARNLAFYQSAMASSDTLKAFADAIPSKELLEQPAEARRGNDVFRSELRRQAQLAVLAFKTGAAVSSDIYLGGFDTHVRNDEGQEWLLGNLSNCLPTVGVADRDTHKSVVSSQILALDSGKLQKSANSAPPSLEGSKRGRVAPRNPWPAPRPRRAQGLCARTPAILIVQCQFHDRIIKLTSIAKQG